MRLFIASPLTNEIKETLGRIIYVLKQERTKVKWVAPQNIHLTLKFLGEVSEDGIENIKAALNKVAEKHMAVKSEINNLGGFPNIKRPRVIWAGLSGGIESLRNIALSIENEMVELGFEKESRPFKSHLTLGRVKDNFKISELAEAIENYDLTQESIIFDEIVLFKSTLTPKGPIYERLHTARLKEM